MHPHGRPFNYGAVKGRFTGTEHVASNHATGKPAHLIFYVETESGEKQVAFNVFSVNQSEVFIHMESNIGHSANPALKDLAAFAEATRDQMLLKHNHTLPLTRCLDIVELGIGFPSCFSQESSNKLIDDLNRFLEVELHNLHTTKGRQRLPPHEVLIFGEVYDDGTGIHQVHVNSYHHGGRGVRGPHADHNTGPKQDGALLIREPDGTWHAVFVAFDTQIVAFTGSPLDQHLHAHRSYHASNPPHPIAVERGLPDHPHLAPWAHLAKK